MGAPVTWHLRRAAASDTETLHVLAGKPAVFRYLFDGVAPSLEQITDWLAESRAFAERPGLGLWLLEDAEGVVAGAVRLHPQSRQPVAELSYLLAPEFWGRGLATRMSWTVIEEAFRRGGIDQVIAGADLPNDASLALMRRLGMTFLRETRYPLGAGAEYLLRRTDPGPARPIATLPLR